jgi:hypothetical protein
MEKKKKYNENFKYNPLSSELNIPVNEKETEECEIIYHLSGEQNWWIAYMGSPHSCIVFDKPKGHYALRLKTKHKEGDWSQWSPVEMITIK